MVQSQTCFDFSVGKCDRGDNCKFQHADEHIPTRRSNEHVPARRGGDRGDRGGRRDGPSTNHRGGSDRCYDFTQGKCDRGSSCKFLHPETCFDFSVGKCDRGDDCRFFHSETHYPPSQRGGSGSFQTTNSGYGPDRRGSSRGRGQISSYRNSQPFRSRNPSPPMRSQRGGAPSDDVCFDFTVGKCDRIKCKFLHPETCYDHSIGKCTRGERCKFLHPGPDNRPDNREKKRQTPPPRPCYDNTQGRCTRGDTCKFSHDEPENQGNAQDIVEGDDGIAPFDNPDAEPQGETCYDFSVGKCNRGDQCRFIHDAERKHVPATKRAAPY